MSRDVYGFTLGYFIGDYTAIGGSTANAFGLAYQPPAPVSGTVTGNGLFNGNISYTTLALSKINSGNIAGYIYLYDQLNRLKEMNRHDINSGASSWSNSSITQAYKEQISYDANGNILTYLRNGADAGSLPLQMDNLTYHYNKDGANNLLNNRLRHVTDAVSSGNYAVDIDNQGNVNFEYDAIGNLKKDVAEGIDNIDWSVYGKIRRIEKAGGTDIRYRYDAAGNRTSKLVSTTSGIYNLFYIRDAQGNTLAIYKDTASALTWQEQHLFGSSRLGIWNWGNSIPTAAPNISETQTTLFDSLLLGSRNYELTNHLGNVLATISDKKQGHNNGSGVVDYFEAVVLTANDYYSGGMDMPARHFNAATDYRYGFNGKEKDKEGPVQYDYGFRIYDPRIVRFKSIDPLFKSYPGLTPYQFASNSAIANVDLDGLEATNYWAATKAEVNGVESLKMNNVEDVVDVQFQQYRLIVKNPTASVNQLYNKVVTDIGSVYNSDYGKFKFEKQTQRNSISVGDYIRIDPAQKGLADIFVKVVGANTTKDAKGNVTEFNYQFRTLEGHVEVGEITFSAKSVTNANGNSFLHFMIESNSQIDPAIAQIVSGFTDVIRNQQIDTWSQTMGNILKVTGGEKQESSAYIETYENGVLNKDFRPIKNNPSKIGEPIKDPKKVEQKALPATPPASGG